MRTRVAFWEDRVIGIVGLIALIGVISFLSYRVGVAEGEETIEPWRKKYAAAIGNCRTYPDGSQKCEPIRNYVAPSKIECIRACTVRTRMEAVK
jgi:hypothetical protein